MRPSKRDILIATRRSRLAMTQSESVGQTLAHLNPRVGLRFVPLESEGDRVTDHPLALLGGKGLFTRTIERAILGRDADIAVHSFKDLPTELTAGLVIAAVPRRAPVHDVLISATALRIDELPKGAKVGTCSPRRAAQLLRIRPDLRIVPLRGNVDTRVKKVLDERVVDATLLAAAGLHRLGLHGYAANAVPVEDILPAPAQGAIAVQCRADDHVTLRRCVPLNDAMSALCVHAERQVTAGLRGDCHSPIAVLAEAVGDAELRVRARVLSPDGRVCLASEARGPMKSSPRMCDQVVEELLGQGARRVLDEAANSAAAIPEP